VQVSTAAGDDLADSDDGFRVTMRQIMGVFSQLEKTRLAKKLKAPRDRKRGCGQKVEDRKSHVERRPEAVAMAKRLHRANPVTGKRNSLRKIAAELAGADHVSEQGQPFNPKSIRSMIEGARPGRLMRGAEEQT
jgi:hypothetical protein